MPQHDAPNLESGPRDGQVRVWEARVGDFFSVPHRRRHQPTYLLGLLINSGGLRPETVVGLVALNSLSSLREAVHAPHLFYNLVKTNAEHMSAQSVGQSTT